ncbi:MAG: metallopeptidase family protein [Nocardioides sp.]
MYVDRAEFERLVEAALDDIPDEIARQVDNVVVLVEDDPPAGEPDLLGVYVGVSLTERTHDHTGLPDRITVFRRPLMEMCRDRAELVHEIGVTLVHEVAHHFGIDDARLHELGYG